MKIELHRGPLSADVAWELSDFAAGFSHSLGQAGRFRVELGPDPSRFFRSLGDSVFVLARHEERLCGSLALSLNPDVGSVYLGELKTAPGPQRGRILLALAAAAKSWMKEQNVVPCHAFVMDGSVSPVDYTGRLGLPPLTRLLDASIDLVPASFGHFSEEVEESPLPMLLRSSQTPLLLLCRSASARLLDTWAAKRLFDPEGKEIRRLHLGRLEFDAPEDAVTLMRHAAARAAQVSARGLFLAMRPQGRRRLPFDLLAAWPEPAKYAVFGHGHERWDQPLCSSEI